MIRSGRVAVLLSALVTAETLVALIGCEDTSMPPLPPSTYSVDESKSEESSASKSTAVSPLPPPPADVGIRPRPKPPHQGQLVPFDGEQGYVEWVVGSGESLAVADAVVARAYFLDSEGEPLDGVENASLWVATSQGPRRIRFVDCEDAEYRGTCMTATLRRDRRDESANLLNGVIRFELDGMMRRVVLPSKQIGTLPAGMDTLPADSDSLPP